MENYEIMKSLVFAIQTDIEKFESKSTKAAGRRVRKAMLEIKNLAHSIRKEISNSGTEDDFSEDFLDEDSEDQNILDTDEEC